MMGIYDRLYLKQKDYFGFGFRELLQQELCHLTKIWKEISEKIIYYKNR
jgi:hypothetical protein